MSLELHLSKRKVPHAEPQQDQFAGFIVNSSVLIQKQTRQCLAKSQWIELNEMCNRLNVQIVKENDQFTLRIGNEVLTSSRAIYKALLKLQLQEIRDTWCQLPYQGLLARNLDYVDMDCSIEHLKNSKLSDRMAQFIVKARLQICETNSQLHTMYPDIHGRSCRLCQNPSDTISHVLNGCMSFQDAYSNRHN